MPFSKAYLLFFLVIMFFTTCKKYPEGGFRKYAHNGLINETGKFWKLDLYEVNGIDSTNQVAVLANLPDYKEKFLHFWTIKQRYFRYDFADCHSWKYKFQFINDNKQIIFFTGYTNNETTCIVTSNGCERNVLNPEGKITEWNIEKLQKNELKLTSNQNNSYKLILKK